MASPSSPTAAMATPKTKLKTTRPEIQKRKIFMYYYDNKNLLQGGLGLS
jgi:hypothetical protein